MHLQSISRKEKAEVLEELWNWVFYACDAAGIPDEDARDVSQFAVKQLFRHWETIKAPHGKNSLKAWLETTATREYLRLIAKEKRNETSSLQDALSASEAEEAQTLEDSLADPTIDDAIVVRRETVQSVRAVLEKMPKRCELRRDAFLKACDKTCAVLWTRYMREDKKLSIAEISLEFAMRPRTIYDRLCACKDRFQDIWKETS